MILFIKLLLAHLIGDFLLQPDNWIKEKEEKKLKSLKLYIHILLHGALAFLLVWDWAFWLPALVIAVSHGAIDAAKLLFQKDKYKREWFLIDQLLHLVVITVVSYYWQNLSISIESIITEKRLIFLTAIVALTLPASVVIKIFISKWAPYTEANDGESLQNAGKFIGILERLFVLAFVLTGHWEAIGFLIAAKSVFRFGDLKESKDRKLTEYILIGTLISFGIALVVGMLVRHLFVGIG